MLFNIFIVLHLIGCVLLVVVVLMQSSRGGALSAAFGGSGGTIFGGRETATFLSKATTVLAIVFFLTSLSLAFLSSGRGGVTTGGALKRAAGRQQYGTVVPEDQKNVDEVLGKVPQPAQEETQKGGSAKQPEKLPAPQGKSGK
jgi:preprotein translocase subunit SecG